MITMISMTLCIPIRQYRKN